MPALTVVGDSYTCPDDNLLEGNSIPLPGLGKYLVKG